MLPVTGITKKAWKNKTNASAGSQYTKTVCSQKKLRSPWMGTYALSRSKVQSSKQL